jgi:hypothetical protein
MTLIEQLLVQTRQYLKKPSLDGSPERQRMMLGQGRYEAWKRGEFDLRDVAKLHQNPVWGNAWQERSLKELLNEP